MFVGQMPLVAMLLKEPYVPSIWGMWQKQASKLSRTTIPANEDPVPLQVVAPWTDGDTYDNRKLELGIQILYVRLLKIMSSFFSLQFIPSDYEEERTAQQLFSKSVFRPKINGTKTFWRRQKSTTVN